MEIIIFVYAVFRMRAVFNKICTFADVNKSDMTKLVIFDLDGTLLDTIDDLATSTNYALQCAGYPQHDLLAYRYFVGNGINKLIERALPYDKKTESEVARLRKDFVEYYGAHMSDHTKPYDGIVSLLEELQSRSIMIAVASNKYQEATRTLVAKFFPQIQFSAIFGQRNGIAPKPDPTIVFDILQIAGVGKDEVLYVGDTNVDMTTARNSGVRSVGVTWGFRPQLELEESGANFIVHRPEDILAFL